MGYGGFEVRIVSMGHGVMGFCAFREQGTPHPASTSLIKDPVQSCRFAAELRSQGGSARLLRRRCTGAHGGCYARDARRRLRLATQQQRGAASSSLPPSRRGRAGRQLPRRGRVPHQGGSARLLRRRCTAARGGCYARHARRRLRLAAAKRSLVTTSPREARGGRSFTGPAPSPRAEAAAGLPSRRDGGGGGGMRPTSTSPQPEGSRRAATSSSRTRSSSGRQRQAAAAQMHGCARRVLRGGCWASASSRYAAWSVRSLQFGSLQSTGLLTRPLAAQPAPPPLARTAR